MQVGADACGVQHCGRVALQLKRPAALYRHLPRASMQLT
jgi:hypothetical protein